MNIQKIFWVTNSVQSYQKKYAKELDRLDYNVTFFTSLDELAFKLAEETPPIIFFSDFGDDLYVEQRLLKFLKISDVHGTKLILDSCSGCVRTAQLAITSGFRDIIPAKMITSEWLERFQFSTSSRAKYSKAPSLMLTVNLRAVALIPAKITRFGRGYLRIETKMSPPHGTSIGISGSLVKAMGLKKLVVKMAGKGNTRLTYRFSQALELWWDVNQLKNPEKFEKLLSHFSRSSEKPRRRVFIVCNELDVRRNLQNQLRGTDHDLRTAASLTGMVNDPKFFTPDLTIVESKFIEGESSQSFSKFCQNLVYGSVVIILGQSDNFEHFQKKFSKIILYPHDGNIDDKVREWLSLLSPASKEKGKFEVPYNHQFSDAFLPVPARISKLHPKMGEIKFPLHVGDFSLVELDVASLTSVYGKRPVIKVASYQKITTRSGSKDKFVHKNIFYFADVNLDDRVKLNRWMAEKFFNELEVHGGTISKFSQPSENIDIDDVPDVELKKHSPRLSIGKGKKSKTAAESGDIEQSEMVSNFMGISISNSSKDFIKNLLIIGLFLAVIWLAAFGCSS